MQGRPVPLVLYRCPRLQSRPETATRKNVGAVRQYPRVPGAPDLEFLGEVVAEESGDEMLGPQSERAELLADLHFLSEVLAPRVVAR